MMATLAPQAKPTTLIAIAQVAQYKIQTMTAYAMPMMIVRAWMMP